MHGSITLKVTFMSLTFVTGRIIFQSQPITAHAPMSIDLFYDYGNQHLFVTIGYSPLNNSTHYVSQINVTLKGEHYPTVDYIGQEVKFGMTDDFPAAVPGVNITGVTAYWDVDGSIHDEITVLAAEHTTETSPTNTSLTDINATTDSGNDMLPGLAL